MSEEFVSKAVDENGDGLDVYRIVQVGSGSTSGLVTDDSEIFRLDTFSCYNTGIQIGLRGSVEGLWRP
jgi:hypothetical protein